MIPTKMVFTVIYLGGIQIHCCIIGRAVYYFRNLVSIFLLLRVKLELGHFILLV